MGPPVIAQNAVFAKNNVFAENSAPTTEIMCEVEKHQKPRVFCIFEHALERGGPRIPSSKSAPLYMWLRAPLPPSSRFLAFGVTRIGAAAKGGPCRTAAATVAPAFRAAAGAPGRGRGSGNGSGQPRPRQHAWALAFPLALVSCLA